MNLKQVIDGTFTLEKRPIPMAGDLRMAWGLAILLLTLFYSRGKKASIPKLQLAAHSVRLPEGQADIRSLLKGSLRTSDLQVRVEPWLNRAINFAHALRLIEVTNGKSVTLTPAGEVSAKGLLTVEGALEAERSFLSEAARGLTEAVVRKIWHLEDLI